jgi:flagellar hook-basal body complex protein FliE
MDDMRIGNVPQVSLGDSEEVKQKGATGFADVIKGTIAKVGSLEKEADESIIDLLKGKADVGKTMVALQKADISMRLVLAIRNKVIEAYRELMHMQF